jgi:spore maturation protein CgeB
MINDIEQLKSERPDLVKKFEELSKEDLLKATYLEVIDAVNMESRVALFMQECTENMSKTNYTLDSIQTLINNKKESDIKEFCFLQFEDDLSDEEIIAELREQCVDFEM